MANVKIKHKVKTLRMPDEYWEYVGQRSKETNFSPHQIIQHALHEYAQRRGVSLKTEPNQ